MKTNKKIKVLVALSGGVDSSVAAALLVRAGYTVEAAYMVNFDDGLRTTDYGLQTKKNSRSLSAVVSSQSSCWLPDYRDAVRVAAHLNIPIHKFDFTDEYRTKVLDYMFAEYAVGRTPNPDVLCNTFIKFGSWLAKAKELGFDYLATGHYTCLSKSIKSIKSKVHNVKLLESKDKNKDQTYFLHQLNQGQLARVLFPIGGYTKPQVRALAKKFKLPTAAKAESMGICFVGEVPMKEFLSARIKPTPGKIVLSDGTVMGGHDGLPFYTMGQRHIGIESQKSIKSLKSVKSDHNKPLYVVAKNIKTNELVVGYDDDPNLYKKEIQISDVRWVAGQAPKFPLKCLVRLRHRQELQKCVVEGVEGKGYRVVVKCKTPQRAVTPGQFAVFYLKGECLGGGVIS